MKKISFIPINKYVTTMIAPPEPAGKHLPDWYKEQPALSGDKLSLNSSGVHNGTIKKCMPVLDDITAGYYILCASDILVNKDENGDLNFTWSLDINEGAFPEPFPPLISTHGFMQISHLPIPDGFSRYPFKFNNYYRIKTPKGYSCLFRHPSWVFNTPFYTLSGLVDTDKHPTPINFPFLIKDNWEGVIEAGTPLVQIIPFRRTEWESEIVGEDNYAGLVEFQATTKKIMNRYKDNWRSLKKWK